MEAAAKELRESSAPREWAMADSKGLNIRAAGIKKFLYIYLYMHLIHTNV